MKFLLDELGQAFAYALRTPPAFAEDQAVICVTHERMTAALQLLVQFVEHDVAQQRTERTSLRRSLRCRLIYSVDHHASIKVFVYQAYDPAVLYGVGEQFYQVTLVYGVKEAFQVYAHGIFIAFVEYLLRLFQRPLCAAVRSEAVASLAELRLIHRRKYLRYTLLDDAVHQGRYSQFARLAIVFRDFHPAHWHGLIFPVQDGVPEFIFVEFQVWKQVLCLHRVDTSAPAVRYYLPICSVHIMGRKDEFHQVFLIYLHFRKSAFGYLHIGLRSLDDFGFQPIFPWAALIRFLLSFLHRVSSLDLLQIKFGPSLRVDIRQVLWPLLTSRSSLLLLAFARLRDLSSYGHTLSILCLPDLPWAISDSYRTSISFAILSSPLGLLSDFCPSDQMFAAGFLQIPSRGGHPCLWL